MTKGSIREIMEFIRSGTVEQLQAMKGLIEQRLEETEKERIEEARKEMEALAAKHGVSLHQVFFKGGSAKGRKLPIKYKDDKGNTWTGQGAKPKWMGNNDPEQFRVTAEAAE